MLRGIGDSKSVRQGESACAVEDSSLRCRDSQSIVCLVMKVLLAMENHMLRASVVNVWRRSHVDVAQLIVRWAQAHDRRCRSVAKHPLGVLVRQRPCAGNMLLYHAEFRPIAGSRVTSRQRTNELAGLY